YMVAAATVEHHGIPMDVHLLDRIKRRWDTIKLRLIDAIDGEEFDVYENGHFRYTRLEAYCALHGIPWPRLPSGRLAMDAQTFRLPADRYPAIAPLWELKHTLDDLKLHELTVGKDGRTRAMLSAYRSKTGRNQPSNSHFVFGPAKWTRGLIKPGPGRAIAYLDYAAQEIAIAGALSSDEQLWADYA